MFSANKWLRLRLRLQKLASSIFDPVARLPGSCFWNILTAGVDENNAGTSFVLVVLCWFEWSWQIFCSRLKHDPKLSSSRPPDCADTYCLSFIAYIFLTSDTGDNKTLLREPNISLPPLHWVSGKPRLLWRPNQGGQSWTRTGTLEGGWVKIRKPL